ncbi:MAG TPA: carbon-nitrogen hydrolase family protein [Lacipirellulaceae bacterium]|nr:carbon-nitrogen hydrolase family protein [Lacipirellulaceae bacterium]
MTTAECRIGMAQILVEGAEPAANLERAEEFIREAASQGCRLVVLPECMDLGWTDPSARRLAQPIPGPHSQRLADVAKAAGVYVVAGLVERTGDRLFNAAVLIDPRGQIVLLHRKINELEIAQDLYAIGDRLAVAHTEIGTLGINICADNFPNSLAIAHVLARMGAQLLLSPSAWAVDADHDNEREPYGARWREAFGELGRLYDLPVIAVSNVGWLTDGPWKGRKSIGCSLATDHRGQILAEGPYGDAAEALIVVDMILRQSSLRGTQIADDLAARGYVGP